MAPQVMRSEMNAHNIAGFGDHFPGGLVTDRKNALIGLDIFFFDVILQPIGKALGDKKNSCSLPLLGSTRVNLRSFKSPAGSFNTSLMRIPPLAINSSINLFRGLVVLKIISSMVSFSIMFHL
jgi:hypothetical protein